MNFPSSDHHSHKLTDTRYETVIITDIGPSPYLGNQSKYWHNPFTFEKREGNCPGPEWFNISRRFYYDIPGIFYVSQYNPEGKLVSIGAGELSEEFGTEIRDNPQLWLGAVIDVKLPARLPEEGYSANMVFLRRRDDKHPSDCRTTQL